MTKINYGVGTPRKATRPGTKPNSPKKPPVPGTGRNRPAKGYDPVKKEWIR